LLDESAPGFDKPESPLKTLKTIKNIINAPGMSHGPILILVGFGLLSFAIA
jgi:hypothetical protein